MPFTKVKYAKGEVTLEWTDSLDGTGTITHLLSSSDEPVPEFVDALQNLRHHVLDVCELPKGYESDLRISGVTITSHDSLGRGMVVTAIKKLARSQGPLVINTPHLTEVAASDASPRLSHAAIVALDQVEEQAADYRMGRRAQGSLL